MALRIPVLPLAVPQRLSCMPLLSLGTYRQLMVLLEALFILVSMQASFAFVVWWWIFGGVLNSEGVVYVRRRIYGSVTINYPDG